MNRIASLQHVFRSRMHRLRLRPSATPPPFLHPDFTMLGFTKPFRSDRRIALTIALSVLVIILESRAWGQSVESVLSIPDVIVTTPPNFPVAEFRRHRPPQPRPPQPMADSQSPTAAEELTKSTFVFSRIQLGPIQLRPIQLRPMVPSKPPAELPLPPEIAERRDEIEHKSLARIFANGMITNYKIIRADSEMESAATETVPDNSSPQLIFQRDEVIVSDVLIESSTLPEPPLVGDRIQELANPPKTQPRETTPQPRERLPAPLSTSKMAQGMIEDDTPGPIIANDLLDLEPQTKIEVQNQVPGEMQLPNYAMPGGGLDIYLLAPTRFSQPLPNAR